jgi:hypothetical protein
MPAMALGLSDLVSIKDAEVRHLKPPPSTHPFPDRYQMTGIRDQISEGRRLSEPPPLTFDPDT